MLRAGTLHKQIPQGQIGGAEVRHDTPDGLTRLRAQMHGQPLYAETYTRLFVDGRLYMTDAEFECRTNATFVSEARGDVLIAGLGLGLIVGPLLQNHKVDSITVIEKSADVIALIAPLYNHCKFHVVNADVKTWPVPKKGFDYIYLDIWADVPNSDTLAEIKELKKRYRAALKKGGRVKAWCESYARR